MSQSRFNDASVTLISNVELDSTQTGQIITTVNSNDTHGDTATTTVAGSDDDTVMIDSNDSFDGGDGFDVVTLNADIDLDFSDINLNQIKNIEEINLESGTHDIKISLDDILEMTDDDNHLDISALSNDADSIELDTSGWTYDATDTSVAGEATYEYHNNDDVSVTVTVDDTIDII